MTSRKPISVRAVAEGLPFPLGATWIEEQQAFNFALYSKHAESVELRRRLWRLLLEAGGEVRAFNPPRRASPLGWLTRDHRRCSRWMAASASHDMTDKRRLRRSPLHQRLPSP